MNWVLPGKVSDIGTIGRRLVRAQHYRGLRVSALTSDDPFDVFVPAIDTASLNITGIIIQYFPASQLCFIYHMIQRTLSQRIADEMNIL